MTAAKSFKQMIKDGEIKRADAMKVRLEDLHEEPGFNLRIEGEDLEWSILDLAAFIGNGGQVPPLEVRPRAEGGLYVVDGHRRRRAYLSLDGRGMLPRDPSGEFWVSVVPFTGNDADRVARVITSQEGRKLFDLEVADGCKRLAAFGWTPDQIAKAIGKTRQRVDQLLILANSNSDVKQLVASGAVSGSVAIDMVRKHGEQAGAELAEELEKAQAQGKAKVTAGTMKGPSVPRNLLDDLHQTAAKLHKAFTTDDLVAIDRYHRGEITEGTVTISLDAAMQVHLILEESARVLADKEQRLREKQNKEKQLELEE
ncbi:hypothetical protein [Pseudomonas phage PPpW-3]|uniref:ParB/Spo0J HTH domain-containing protein n=1 Tax=Pseudomonas phage PPpW-3 TaxID=1279082 RepID=V5YTD4_9CAUD|nr:ParB-like partition protein [Pseudomonas phage PPpW-3]BAO20637.1 hypothetical protein [Pseudomonas phage PPpW-3]